MTQSEVIANSRLSLPLCRVQTYNYYGGRCLVGHFMAVSRPTPPRAPVGWNHVLCQGIRAVYEWASPMRVELGLLGAG